MHSPWELLLYVHNLRKTFAAAYYESTVTGRSPCVRVVAGSKLQGKGDSGSLKLQHGFWVEYGVRARLSRPGALHHDGTAKATVRVLSKPEEARPAVPVVVGPDIQKMKKAFVFNSGR